MHLDCVVSQGRVILHRGDIPEFVLKSFLTEGAGARPSIVVTKERKGTIKEVQTITVNGGGDNVDPTSSFRLRLRAKRLETFWHYHSEAIPALDQQRQSNLLQQAS